MEVSSLVCAKKEGTTNIYVGYTRHFPGILYVVQRLLVQTCLHQLGPILTLVAMIYYGTTLMLNILDVQQSPVPALPRIITLAATDMRIFSTWAACVLFLSIPYLVLIAR